jgi:hypothetical protein
MTEAGFSRNHRDFDRYGRKDIPPIHLLSIKAYDLANPREITPRTTNAIANGRPAKMCVTILVSSRIASTRQIARNIIVAGFPLISLPPP